MKREVSFRKVSGVEEIAGLRRPYLDGLEQAQVLLLEVLVPSATTFAIEDRGSVCGHCILHGEDTLIELHLAPSHWACNDSIFEQAVEQLGVRRALVKSFDQVFLSSCIAAQTGVKCLGVLGRDYAPQPLPERGELAFSTRLATLEDLPRIERIEQKVFTDRTRFQHVIEQGYLYVFEREGALLAFGMLRPVVDGKPHVELGLALDVPYRKRGESMYMLRELAERARRDGLLPIGSCAADNPASRAMSEHIGFVARFRLLELSFAPPTAQASA